MTRLSDDQTEELITITKNDSSTRTELAKKLIIWLIFKSDNCSKNVAVSIYPKSLSEYKEISKLANEVMKELLDQNDFFLTINSQMIFSQDYGIYLSAKGMKCFAKEGSIIDKNGSEICSIDWRSVATIWLAQELEDHTSEVLELNMDEIHAIQL